MCDQSDAPLTQLIDDCARATTASSLSSPACHQLVRRAICDQNDAAWDAVVIPLRSLLLRQVYARAADVSPARADAVVTQTLNQLRNWGVDPHAFNQRFPTFQSILDRLFSEVAKAVEQEVYIDCP